MWLPLTRPPLGTWPATQACALTGNQTSDLLVLRPVLNPLSHTSQGTIIFLVLPLVIPLKKKPKILFILERCEGREEERERNICQLPLACAPTGDQACNPGMYSDWVLNWQPLVLRDDTRPNQPRLPG